MRMLIIALAIAAGLAAPMAEACPPANEAERRILDTLVNGVMEILRKLVLSELH